MNKIYNFNDLVKNFVHHENCIRNFFFSSYQNSGSIPRNACVAWETAMLDYQESVTTGQTDRQTDAGQSDPYVPLCFAGDTKMKVIHFF